MRIQSFAFQGEKPAVAPHLLGERHSTIARNCYLRDGNIEPMQGTTLVLDPTKTGTLQSIYRWGATPGNPGSGVWFHWTEDVDVARSVIVGDTEETVYFTGVGTPKKTDASHATSGGGTNYPLDWLELGIPSPANKPTVALIDVTGNISSITKATNAKVTCTDHGLPTGATVKITGVLGMTQINNVTDTITVVDDDNFTLDNTDSSSWGTYTDNGTTDIWTRVFQEDEKTTRFYAYTYYSNDNEEGAPAPFSDGLQVGDGQSVQITNLSTAPGGDYDIGYKNIYRTITVNGVTTYEKVTQVTVANTSYTDSKLDEELGEELPSLEWDMPPADLAGIVSLDNGVTAGFSENFIATSAAKQPHAWPTTQRYPTDYPVVAIAASGNTVYAATQRQPYMLVGNDPARMSLVKIAVEQGCISKRSMVGVGTTGVVYASPDGLVLIGQGGYRLLTEGILKKSQWDAMNPDTLFGLVHDGKYWGFYDTGAFMLDPANPDNGIIHLDIVATGGYVDHLTDTMYLLISDVIYSFDTGSNLVATWQSREYLGMGEAAVQAGMVRAETYNDIDLEVYCDGVLKHTQQNISSSAPFRLPGGYRWNKLQFKVSTTDDVIEVRLATTMSELDQDGA